MITYLYYSWGIANSQLHQIENNAAKAAIMRGISGNLALRSVFLHDSEDTDHATIIDCKELCEKLMTLKYVFT